jgi:hypothetical protein
MHPILEQLQPSPHPTPYPAFRREKGKKHLQRNSHLAPNFERALIREARPPTSRSPDPASHLSETATAGLPAPQQMPLPPPASSLLVSFDSRPCRSSGAALPHASHPTGLRLAAPAHALIRASSCCCVRGGRPLAWVHAG